MWYLAEILTVCMCGEWKIMFIFANNYKINQIDRQCVCILNTLQPLSYKVCLKDIGAKEDE